MIDISLCMIVKNEEDVLGRCLESVKDIADEIIIVDTGSTDSTKEIAKKYTNNIYDFEWVDDFSKARNFAFSKATKQYIMWLDADDVILEKDKIKLEKLKKEIKDDVDIVMMKYDIAFDENGNPTFSYYRERLFLKSKNYKWKRKNS
jgi:glycosyltransferase involved in cell wall biosynthesis